MQKRILGKTGLEVSVLGFGGAEIGFEAKDPASVFELINQAIDQGVNLFDSAAAYLASEQLIGKALGSKRKEVLIATKCGPLDGFTRSDWSKGGLLKSVEKSLENLKTDYIDILLLHSCGPLEFLMGEAGTALQIAKEKGMARFIGYSGDGLAAVNAIKCGMFDVLELSLSIADQEAIDLLLPLAVEADMGVIAKRPIANAVWKYTERPKIEYILEYWERLNKLDYDFLKGDVKEAVKVALNFTLAQKGVHSAIVGTSKKERIAENIDLLKTPLTSKEIETIRHHWKKIAPTHWVAEV
jgi:aryl-alcohol dehydrogenase-like predicted oxidoreductase